MRGDEALCNAHPHRSHFNVTFSSQSTRRMRLNWELVHKNVGRFMVVLGFFQAYTGLEAALPVIGEDSRTACNAIVFVILFAILSSYSFFERFKGPQNTLTLEHEI